MLQQPKNLEQIRSSQQKVDRLRKYGTPQNGYEGIAAIARALMARNLEKKNNAAIGELTLPEDISQDYRQSLLKDVLGL